MPALTPRAYTCGRPAPTLELEVVDDGTGIDGIVPAREAGLGGGL
jgi:hypothetical protein